MHTYFKRHTQYTHTGKRKGRGTQSLGLFDTGLETALKYDEATRRYGRAEELLNFPHLPIPSISALNSKGIPVADAKDATFAAYVSEYERRRKYKGVMLQKGYVTRCRINGSPQILGTALEAALKYDEAARSHGRAEELLNFPRLPTTSNIATDTAPVAVPGSVQESFVEKYMVPTVA
jgi:hypothetical protein